MTVAGWSALLCVVAVLATLAIMWTAALAEWPHDEEGDEK